MTDLIVGVDCATQAKRVGLALAQRSASGCRVVEVKVCRDATTPAEVIAEWIGDSARALLALDAPLGWPAPLGDALSKHAAGVQVTEPANILFRRNTDRFVASLTRKTPLDVGADRIARTAHWALFLLTELRRRLEEPIPLAWGTPLEERVAAIEVYPAATLIAHGAVLKGYKADEGLVERQTIFRMLEMRVDFSPLAAQICASADILDAVVCVLAAVDFLEGMAIPPDQPQLALKEGWIWVRRPSVGTNYR